MIEFLNYVATCEKEKLVVTAIFFAAILARPIIEKKIEELKGGV